MTFTNSPLVNYTKISPHRTPNRNHAIDTVTIHCVVGQCTVEALGELFQTKECSSNYGIGYDGRIGMYCEEKDRSWCSSSGANDHRAITIEVASDTVEPYAVKSAAYNALIKLLVDICKRNGIKQLLWKADKSLIGQTDKQNMTVHRWFANKSCPGTYLYERHSQIAAEVNNQLGTVDNTSESSVLYRVQVGAFKVKENALAMVENLKKAGFDAFVTEANVPAPEKKIEVGSNVKIKSGARDYDGGTLNDYVYDWILQVKRIDNGDRVVVTHNGETTAAVNIKDLIII